MAKKKAANAAPPNGDEVVEMPEELTDQETQVQAEGSNEAVVPTLEEQL